MLLICIHYKLEERRYHGPLVVTESKWVIGVPIQVHTCNRTTRLWLFFLLIHRRAGKMIGAPTYTSDKLKLIQMLLFSIAKPISNGLDIALYLDSESFPKEV